MTLQRLMCPPRRPSWEMLNEVDQALIELHHMASIASELSGDLLIEDGRFVIDEPSGQRLSFAIYDVLRRVEALKDTVKVGMSE
jgi:hypothetical protein